MIDHSAPRWASAGRGEGRGEGRGGREKAEGFSWPLLNAVVLNLSPAPHASFSPDPEMLKVFINISVISKQCLQGVKKLGVHTDRAVTNRGLNPRKYEPVERETCEFIGFQRKIKKVTYPTTRCECD